MCRFMSGGVLMKSASDFRAIARDVLRGNWKTAVLVGLVASILGGADSGGPEFTYTVENGDPVVAFEFADQTIFSTGGSIDSGIGAFLASGAAYIGTIAIGIGIVLYILGSVIEIGYARFNLQLVSKQPVSFDALFQYFDYWKTAIAARLLQTLYILLW